MYRKVLIIVIKSENVISVGYTKVDVYLMKKSKSFFRMYYIKMI